ncbi:MAG TPA: PIG-L family deacetylase [Prolixibacteraceae bacterium]|nr:PIG-L family deacetylase [Prolixibacteraceae bacterium]
MENISRRNLIKLSGTAALGLTAFSLAAKESQIPAKKLKIVVVGAHPDDPETACGGTMSLLASEGHEVVAAYLTRGEAGINGKTYDEAAQIRTNEALGACKILNATAKFIGQIDGNCEITASRYTEMYNFLKAEQPDFVFTHWPIDQHRDHRICSILVYDAWLDLKKSFGLYYFEVESGGQTQNFPPTNFVDITSVIEKKHAACYCHVSQNMERVYREYHEHMEIFRGMQANCKYAEAFVKHDQSSLRIV